MTATEVHLLQQEMNVAMQQIVARLNNRMLDQASVSTLLSGTAVRPISMNIQIEKIENGLLVHSNGKLSFVANGKDAAELVQKRIQQTFDK